MADKKSILDIFKTHGVLFEGQRDDQAYGTCPFTGKAGKFYVNANNGLWDSKTAGLSGNVFQFLQFMAEEYAKSITPMLLKKLAQDRRLPESAFRPWDIGWNGSKYTIPVRNPRGEVVDIRMYKLGTKLMLSTKGCHTGLLGSEQLDQRPSAKVFICEGEWDAIALRWMFRKLGLKHVVLAVPGAGTFKQEWSIWLNGRTIHTLYDHDAAGEQGELRIGKRLQGQVAKITYTHWPDDLPDGFDVRDWVVYGAVDRDTAQVCYDKLTQLFRKEPRAEELDNRKKDRASGALVLKRKKKVKAWKRPPRLEDVHAVFNKWLQLKSTDAVDVALATVISQRLDGEPVWLFLVGPPGSAKTAILTSLVDVEAVYSTSTVTAPSLISGANFNNNTDPSLIPRLDGKVLCVKDFTTILGLNDKEKEEIFNILRDAYDGRCGKNFGNGVVRSYVSKFSIIAAVTPSIYDLSHQHASLGERFLKFTIADNLHHDSEIDIITRAIANLEHDTKMKEELAATVNAYLTQEAHDAPVATASTDMKQRLVHLARFGARMRGTVKRDHYHNDIMVARPSAEVGTRLARQLLKLALSLAMLRRRAEVTDDEYRIVRKVMLDTVSQRTEDMVRMLYKMCPTKNDYVATGDVAQASRYPLATVQRVLQDLAALDIVQRRGTAYRHTWTLSPYMRETIAGALLYEAVDERERPTNNWFTLRRKRRSAPTPPTPARVTG